MEVRASVRGNIIKQFIQGVKSRFYTKFSNSTTAIKLDVIFSKIGAKSIIFYTLKSFLKTLATILRTLWRVLCTIKKAISMKEESLEFFQESKIQSQENLRLKREENEIKKKVKELNEKLNDITRKFEQARSKINVYEDPNVLLNLDINTVLWMEKKIQSSIQEITGFKSKVVKQQIKLLIFIYRS